MSVLVKVGEGQYVYRNVPPRHQKPVHRVSRALQRLSRGRWLMPHQVQEIGFRLASLCSGKPMQTFYAAASETAQAIGLVDGIPPAAPWERDRYRFLMELCRDNIRFEALTDELARVRAMEEPQ